MNPSATQYLLDADKVYVTRIRLGVATTTGDAEGDIISEAPVPVLDAAMVSAGAGVTALGGVATTPETPSVFWIVSAVIAVAA